MDSEYKKGQREASKVGRLNVSKINGAKLDVRSKKGVNYFSYEKVGLTIQKAKSGRSRKKVDDRKSRKERDGTINLTKMFL